MRHQRIFGWLAVFLALFLLLPATARLAYAEDTGEDEVEEVTWSDPVWTWSEDYTAATATFTAADDDTRTETVEAAVTGETTPAACEADGLTVYTAAVTFEGTEYTDTREITLPATGHDWGEWTRIKEPTYREEGVEQRVCRNDPSHVESRFVPRLIHPGGWSAEDGKWYYYDENSRPVTGWLQYGTCHAWYYFNADGSMRTGWLQYGTCHAWYYFDANGVMRTGWYQVGGKWYYFTANGDMRTGWVQIGGKWYFFHRANGDMRVGWVQDGGKWYYMNGDGSMRTGWYQIDGKWYYFLPSSGAMRTGWYQVDGKWYYFNENGAMENGWIQVNGKRYFMDRHSGAMRTGWVQDRGKWYYLNPPGGEMLTDCYVGKYYLDSMGTWDVTATNANRYESRTGYLILVNTKTNQVMIFTGESHDWTLLHKFTCCTGAADTPTPEGEFTIGPRNIYFGTEDYRCWYATCFKGTEFLFHSILFDPEEDSPDTVIDGRLGRNISHGCVRLSLENAKWIYDHIPYGTKVVIYH